MIDMKYETVACEALKVSARAVLNDLPFVRNNFEATVGMIHDYCDHLAMELRSYVLGKRSAPNFVKYPANWWQAFKERWCPDFLLRWCPVRYTAVTVDGWNVCPHMNVSMQGPHLMFMLGRHDCRNFSATT